jgi:hypothetical protein
LEQGKIEAAGSAAATVWLIADTVTKLDGRHAGRVVIAGSHGGLYCAYLAAKAGLRGVILNDAGIGKGNAGVAGLVYLDALSMPAATVATMSARIGDGADMARRGIISHVNASAAALDCSAGQSAAECATKMLAAPSGHWLPPEQAEARHPIRQVSDEPEIWALDSASLVRPEDAGRILIVGSHGGAPGGKPEMALQVDALAAVFHDAGVGADKAGISRLPFLDERGIPAATVAADSARIGDGQSLWDTGVLSYVNHKAASSGARPGMTVPAFADRMMEAARKQSPPGPARPQPGRRFSS